MTNEGTKPEVPLIRLAVRIFCGTQHVACAICRRNSWEPRLTGNLY
jgi:hypothetical protein